MGCILVYLVNHKKPYLGSGFIYNFFKSHESFSLFLKNRYITAASRYFCCGRSYLRIAYFPPLSFGRHFGGEKIEKVIVSVRVIKKNQFAILKVDVKLTLRVARCRAPGKSENC